MAPSLLTVLLTASTLVLLSGCADPASDGPAATTSADPSPGAVEPVLYYERKVVLDVNKTFDNPIPPPAPAIGDNEFEVATLSLPDGALNVDVNFTRVQTGTTFFADNCRLYRGQTLLDQAAFSDAQYGQVNTTGTCDLHFDSLDAGDYRIVYLCDQLFPTGSHDVHVLVTGDV